MQHPEDDHLLMERVARGDAEAFRTLTARHAPSITAHARRMLRDASEAEDMVQEAFLRLWKNAATYRPEARLGTFLHRIVHNLCVDALRSRKKTDADALDGLPSEERPSRELLVRTRAQRVHDEVGTLPERQRAALSLVHFEGLTNVEAAEILQVSVEALESLLSRARRTLRERLSSLAGEQAG
ncbi:MAG: sigma-70 family RNA polymerase sigma factor [Myxococcales bacterium]